MAEFYYPESKRELLEFIKKHYPADMARFKSMKVKQLRAIHLSIINKFLQKT